MTSLAKTTTNHQEPQRQKPGPLPLTLAQTTSTKQTPVQEPDQEQAEQELWDEMRQIQRGHVLRMEEAKQRLHLAGTGLLPGRQGQTQTFPTSLPESPRQASSSLSLSVKQSAFENKDKDKLMLLPALVDQTQELALAQTKVHPKLAAIRQKLQEVLSASPASYQYEYDCGVCEDTGQVAKHHFILKVMGQELAVTFQTPLGEALVYEPCTNHGCTRGLTNQLSWRTGGGSQCPASCYKGWLVYERVFGEANQLEAELGQPALLAKLASAPQPHPDPAQTASDNYNLFCEVCEAGRELRAKLHEHLAEVKRELVTRRYERGGIAEDMRSKTFDNFQTQPVTQSVLAGGTGNGAGEIPGPSVAGQLVNSQEAAELTRAKALVYRAAQLGKSISMFGTPGSGKSHLAAAYLNYAMAEQGKSGIFISVIGLLQNLRGTLKAPRAGNESSSSEAQLDWTELLARYTSVEILVLDDLGTEKTSDTTLEVLFHLLNRRITDRLPTVVTSNYSLDELASSRHGYTRAIISRLGSFARVSWQAGDWRDKEAYLAEQLANAELGLI